MPVFICPPFVPIQLTPREARMKLRCRSEILQTLASRDISSSLDPSRTAIGLGWLDLFFRSSYEFITWRNQCFLVLDVIFDVSWHMLGWDCFLACLPRLGGCYCVRELYISASSALRKTAWAQILFWSWIVRHFIIQSGSCRG